MVWMSLKDMKLAIRAALGHETDFVTKTTVLGVFAISISVELFGCCHKSKIYTLDQLAKTL